MVSSYTALAPPMNLGRVRAATTIAAPIVWFSSRTGTATFLRCMPMSVKPISSPASALISSSATGSLSAAYTCVASEPPAFGCGTTFTISAPGTAVRSVMMARFNSANASYGESYLLVTILAAVLGGVDPFGGYGKVGNVSSWTAANGRQWRVECDTAATGRGGCRSYIKTGNYWLFNNIVLFN